jgi:hypothetical protein
MTIFILKLLAFYTFVSFIALVIAWYWMKVAKREPANHLPPLPHNSILDNHPRRVL